MIKSFLRENRSWIFLFIGLQLLMLFVGTIDSSINITSILYISFLSIMVFIIFIVVQYNKQIDFFKSLQEWNPGDDIANIKESKSPFEEITEHKLHIQADYYKNELEKSITSLEQEKDDLLSWIHEVKTPLTAMQLMLERLEDETLKSQLMYEWLRIHLLLDQQLHQRRIPFMENDLYIEKVDLEGLIYNEIKPLRSWCMQKGIGFDVSLQVSEVLTDAKWLSFIIRQLLTNAVKYSDSSDIVVSSFMESGTIQLKIQDAGRGIPSKDLPRIFDKGFTSTANHKDNAATGMGLYLTKKTAEVLKIHIEVQSKVGEGTTFTLTFAKKNDLLAITSM